MAKMMSKKKDGYLIQPDPLDRRLTERVKGIDQTGTAIEISVTVERALTIFLNAQAVSYTHLTLPTILRV